MFAKVHSRNSRNLLRKGAVYILTIFVAIVMGLPILWMISISIRPIGETFSLTLFPTDINLEAYRSIILDPDLRAPFINSLIVGVSTTLLALTLGIPAAYALSRFNLRGKEFMLTYVLSTKMFPPILLTISYFFLVSRIKLYDTLLIVILMDTVIILPFVLWMMYNYFNSIPREVDEAAKIDGASKLLTLLKIIIPISFPGVAATSVYGFLLTWNEFLFAFTFTQSLRNRVVPVTIVAYQGEFSTDYPTLLAFAVLFIIPILVLFVAMQRYMIQGLASGSIK